MMLVCLFCAIFSSLCGFHYFGSLLVHFDSIFEYFVSNPNEYLELQPLHDVRSSFLLSLFPHCLSICCLPLPGSFRFVSIFCIIFAFSLFAHIVYNAHVYDAFSFPLPSTTQWFNTLYIYFSTCFLASSLICIHTFCISSDNLLQFYSFSMSLFSFSYFFSGSICLHARIRNDG